MESKNNEIIENFRSLKTRTDVADLLEINDKSLRYFLFVKRPENMYTTFSIKKRNGGSREICAPNRELKTIQRKLAYILSLIYSPKICAYGFIKNKSIIENAGNHIKRGYVLNIDLKDFFHQIHFGRVRGMLKAAPYLLGNEAATTIAQIACYNGHLPQGAPTSPVLTNMICAPLDNQLMRFAKSNDMIYTRYADDLSFSTYRQNFNPDVISIINGQLVLGGKLINILKKNSFEINPQKLKLKTKFERQEVTGLVVNKFPNVKREYVKNLRAIMHNCELNGAYSTAQEYIKKGYCHNKSILAACGDPSKEKLIVNWFIQVVKGKIHFIKQVKGDKSIAFLKFAQQANGIFDKPLFDISSLDQLNEIISKNTFILECVEENTYTQGTGFYIKDIGLITSYHVTKDNGFFKVFTAKSYVENRSLGILSKEINEIVSNSEIDYAIYNLKIDNVSATKIGDSSKLKIGDKIVIAGYPNFKKGDSVTKQSCEIIGKTSYFGAPFFKVSGRVVHGESGGVVFNLDNEVVGIIKGGIATLNEDEENDLQGFVPIHLILDDFKQSVEKGNCCKAISVS